MVSLCPDFGKLYWEQLHLGKHGVEVLFWNMFVLAGGADREADRLHIGGASTGAVALVETWRLLAQRSLAQLRGLKRRRGRILFLMFFLGALLKQVASSVDCSKHSFAEMGRWCAGCCGNSAAVEKMWSMQLPGWGRSSARTSVGTEGTMGTMLGLSLAYSSSRGLRRGGRALPANALCRLGPFEMQASGSLVGWHGC